MALEKSADTMRIVHDYILRKTGGDGNFEAALSDQVVRWDDTGGSATMTLPPVEKARGMHFSIRVAVGNANALTVTDKEGSEDWSDLTMDADGDEVLLFSDGKKWWLPVNGIA